MISIVRSANHMFKKGCLFAQALNGLFVLLDGDLHVPNYAAVALLLLDQSFLHACQDFRQSFVALFELDLLHCHLLVVHLVLLQIFECLKEVCLTTVHFQAVFL